MDLEAFEKFRFSHGKHGSWAVWAEESNGRPRSNIDYWSVLDPEMNPKLLQEIHGRYVAVGLNISGEVKGPLFSNFHSDNPYTRDFIIRYSFRNTPAWGCYLTDALKYFPQMNSALVVKHFRDNPGDLEGHKKVFRSEMSDLSQLFGGSDRPTVLCFGRAAHALVKEFLADFPEEKIVRLRHYSDFRMNQEDHRRELLERMKWPDSPSV